MYSLQKSTWNLKTVEYCSPSIFGFKHLQNLHLVIPCHFRRCNLYDIWQSLHWRHWYLLEIEMICCNFCHIKSIVFASKWKNIWKQWTFLHLFWTYQTWIYHKNNNFVLFPEVASSLNLVDFFFGGDEGVHSGEQLHIPSGEVRKIIDSNVPNGSGICDRSKEGSFLKLFGLSFFLSHW